MTVIAERERVTATFRRLSPPEEIQGTEPHGDPPVLVGSVADAEEDHVPLVPLDVLQVLHEEGLLDALLEEPLHPGWSRLSRSSSSRIAVCCRWLKAITPRLSDGFSRKCPITISAVRLASTALNPPLVPDFHLPVCDVLEPHRRGLPGVQDAREGHQFAVVDVAVREGDQRLPLAAIVPAEAAAGETQGAANVEDALEVLEFLRVLRLVRGEVLVGDRTLEEAGRGQLLLVARDDELLAPVDRADGVVRADLGRLVEDDQVEPDVLRFEVGADRQRAHHQAGLQAGEDGRDAGEEVA